MYLLPDMMASGYCHLSEWFQVTHKNSRGCSVYTSKEYIFLIVVNLLYLPGYIISPITAGKSGHTSMLTADLEILMNLNTVVCLNPAMKKALFKLNLNPTHFLRHGNRSVKHFVSCP